MIRGLSEAHRVCDWILVLKHGVWPERGCRVLNPDVPPMVPAPAHSMGATLGWWQLVGKLILQQRERKSYFSQYKLETLMGEWSQRKTIHMWWVMSAVANDESLVSNSNSSLLLWTVCLQSKINKVQPNSLPISASSLNEHNIPIPLMSFQEHQAIAKEYIY